MQTIREDHPAGAAPRLRPEYPAALFDWLADICPGHDMAWDCGTGNGQAALQLVRHFRRVVACDASPAQLTFAEPHPHIDYRLAPAEDCGLREHSVDLITVAQALHWFDCAAFHAEAQRVLRPGGLIAEWCHGAPRLGDARADALLQHFCQTVVGPYWPAERRHVDSGYRELAFPFAALPAPAFSMQVEWPLARLLGHLRSWSATAACQRAGAGEADPVAVLGEQLAPLWGAAQALQTVDWPLSLRVGHLG